jgi:hypothetical protein
MHKTREAVSLRVGAHTHRYLKLRAHSLGQSISETLGDMITVVEVDEPMAFTLRRVITDGREEYEVAVNGGFGIIAVEKRR